MSLKNFYDTSWDRTSDLPICSTAPKNVLKKLKYAADQVAELEQTETAEGGRRCIGD